MGGFEFSFFQRNQKELARRAMEMYLRVLKESNKNRFDSYSRQEQCIDHIPYYLSGLSRALFFRPPFSKQLYTPILTLPVILKYIYTWSHFGFAGFHVTTPSKFNLQRIIDPPQCLTFMKGQRSSVKTNTQTNFHFERVLCFMIRALGLCDGILISEQSLHQKKYYSETFNV